MFSYVPTHKAVVHGVFLRSCSRFSAECSGAYVSRMLVGGIVGTYFFLIQYVQEVRGVLRALGARAQF